MFNEHIFNILIENWFTDFNLVDLVTHKIITSLMNTEPFNQEID